MSQKAIVLRHDVDNPIWYSVPLNYLLLHLKDQRIRGKSLFPQYLSDVKLLLDYEIEHGVKATWFFRTCTMPGKQIRDKLLASRHEIAYHSDRDENWKTFMFDLGTLEKSLGQVRGVAHHGSKPYNEERILTFIRSAELEYLAQGVTEQGWLKPRRINGVWVFGNHITLKKISAKYDLPTANRIVQNYVGSRKVAQVLLHPRQFADSDKTRKLFKNLVKKTPQDSFLTHVEAIRNTT